MTSSPTRIPLDVMDAAVNGTALHVDLAGGATLRSQLDPGGATLLVFLRHLGCIFCREMVKEVRTAADKADAGQAEKRYPRVVFVHQGSPEQGARFFGRYWPGATAISDPDRRLYDALELARGSLGQILGPRVWVCALRATIKGHSNGRAVGDVWTMPGIFLLNPDGQVLYHKRLTHAGERVDFAAFTDGLVPAPNLLHQEHPRGLPQPA